MRAEFQLVFQDPYSSLNPRMRIVEIIEEGMNALNIETHEKEGTAVRQSGAPKQRSWIALLESVGLRPGSQVALSA